MKKAAIGLYAALTVALMIWGFYQAIYVAPEEQTMHEVQRIFYYHVPSAMVAFLFFAISLAGSIGFLSFRRNRLTTTLVLWLIYVSYLLLRRFAAGPQMQTLAAVLGIFGALDVPIVYMSNRWWRTQHPAPVFGGGPDSGIKDPAMLAAFGWNVLAWLAWGVLILALRYHVERQHQKFAAQEAQDALDA